MLSYVFLFFNDTATTEIYTYDTLFPYTTLFRSSMKSPLWHSSTASRWVAALTYPFPRGIASRLSGQLSPCRKQALASSPTWAAARSEEHTSELQSLMRISYAVFCLKKKTRKTEKVTLDVQHTSECV